MTTMMMIVIDLDTHLSILGGTGKVDLRTLPGEELGDVSIAIAQVH